MSLANALLQDFRKRRGDDCTLLDLEEWMSGKLVIMKRQCKRAPAASKPKLKQEIAIYRAGIREVHSMRFDIIARRAALPRMSVFA